MNDWMPTASIENLQQRAALLRAVRQFFFDRQVLEVETPLLASSTVTDPYIESFAVSHHHKKYYLQTSPEYHMKRLLAAGSGSIFQICKSFRIDESGQLHNPEFSMLEWYRVGFDHLQLMDEVEALLQQLLGISSCERLTYQQAFLRYLDIDPHQATAQQLQNCAAHLAMPDVVGIDCNDKDGWLQQLMCHSIEPQLQNTIIYDFPASQAALAAIRQQGDDQVASRFEVYVNGIELANGYHELTDSQQQRRRMQADSVKRQANTTTAIDIDEKLLAALEHGLPECAGVALGLDRLFMLALDKKQLREVMAFSFDCA